MTQVQVHATWEPLACLSVFRVRGLPPLLGTYADKHAIEVGSAVAQVTGRSGQSWQPSGMSVGCAHIEVSSTPEEHVPLQELKKANLSIHWVSQSFWRDSRLCRRLSGHLFTCVLSNLGFAAP